MNTSLLPRSLARLLACLPLPLALSMGCRPGTTDDGDDGINGDKAAPFNVSNGPLAMAE